MFILARKPHFARKLKKILKKDRHLTTIIQTALYLLAENPLDSRLRSHKVISRNGDKAFSSYVTGDLRIIWRYGGIEEYHTEDSIEHLQILELIDIGGHEGSDKVYKT